MKNILKFTILFCFLIHSDTYAQQMVQNINDLYKLKENEQLFINRPLKNLLQEIKPEIKTGSVINEKHSFMFCFRFTTIEQQKKNEGNSTERISLLVQVSEHIPWYWALRPKNKEIIWTHKDSYEYGDMIITHIDITAVNEEV
ncbi:hypothetical protein [Flavobacterium gelatinilyticum]|uniref:hypothetical protein n=1 Tax=Flavobacterium gelatinilyticum TaxID=3003260 RepID=UPI00247FFC7F|nr:hypothetical protein [Flavobacterium gelatinilyticum]